MGVNMNEIKSKVCEENQANKFVLTLTRIF